MPSLAFLVGSPLLALLPSAVLFLLAARARHWLIVLAATAWLVYAGYEWLMLHRVLCSGDCNIRIDLLLLHPALIGVTLIALAIGLLRIWRGHGANPVSDPKRRPPSSDLRDG